MKDRFLRSLSATVGACAVLGFGIAAVGSGDYAFGPPPGWAKLPSGTDVKWVSPSGREYVTLHPTVFGGDLSSFVAVMLRHERAQNPTQHVWTNRSYYICGDHPGRYVIWTASSRDRTVIWEQFFALWAQDGYVVSYRRPWGAPPNNAARASLLSICGVGETVQPVGGTVVSPQNNARNDVPLVTGAPGSNAQPVPNPTGTISHPYVPVIPDGGN